MMYGIENEDNARRMFQAYLGPDRVLTQTGYWEHDVIEYIGASPDDLLIEEDAIVEYKCPQKMYEGIPLCYYVQVQTQLEVTGARLCYFVAWTPTCMRIWTIKRNRVFWSKILPLIKDFQMCMEEDIEPESVDLKFIVDLIEDVIKPGLL